MNTLIIVAANPGQSHRPAEAVRLAVGLAAWQRLRVFLWLSGPAVRVLQADLEPAVDGDLLRQMAPQLVGSGVEVWTEQDNAWLAQLNQPILTPQPMSTAALAAQRARMERELTL